MAAGITQPGGVGGNIVFQDDANVDAGLDGVNGSYSIEDLYLKVVANGWLAPGGLLPAIEKWNALFPIYWVHVGIQNGDGVLTTTTTWLEGASIILFDAGKTYSVNATGLANRWTKWGALQETAPGDQLGYNGPDVTFGATTIIDGQVQMYGARVAVKAAAVGALTVRRQSTSAAGDLVSCRFWNYSPGANSGINIGTASIPMARGHHLVFGGATANNAVVLCNIADPDDLQFGGASAIRVAVISAFTYLGHPRFVGSPGTADMRGSTGGNDLRDPQWSGQAAQIQNNVDAKEFWTYLLRVQDETNAALSGATVVLKNGAGTTLYTLTTDSNGNISYIGTGSTGITIPMALLARHRASASGTTWIEDGPFTRIISKAGYATDTHTFAWPRTTGTFGDQLEVVSEVVTLRAAVGPTADFRWSPGGGSPGTVVQFTDESLPGDAPITAWAWNFGDGQISSAQSPVHTYTAPGIYTVILIVTTAYGTSTKTIVGAVYVSVPLSPYTRQNPAPIPFVHTDAPSTPFVPQDVAPTTFERTIPADSDYEPCDVPGPGASLGEEFVIFGGVILPTGEPEPRFRHKGVGRGSFRRRSVPPTDFQPCGTDSEPVEEAVIFGGVVIPTDGEG